MSLRQRGPPFCMELSSKVKVNVLEVHLVTDPNHVLQFSVINNKVEFLYLFP